jgi:hypothetical protein
VPTYEQWYSLSLNIPEIENRESFRGYTVNVASAPDGWLPGEWVEASVTSPVERHQWASWALRREWRRGQ